MTKEEMNLCMGVVRNVLEYYSDHPKDIITYLYTDVMMQIRADLDDIRTKSFPLTVSGIDKPVNYKQNKNMSQRSREQLFAEWVEQQKADCGLTLEMYEHMLAQLEEMRANPNRGKPLSFNLEEDDSWLNEDSSNE